MTSLQARALLAFCVERGLAWCEASGYEWFRDSFQPAVSLLVRTAAPRNTRLVADGLRMMGDLFFVHDAPMAAIRAYKRSLKFVKPDANSLTEIGDMMFAIGQLANADWYYRRALAGSPGSDSAAAGRSFVRELRADPNRFKPLYENGDLEWEVSELLAQSKAPRALAILGDPSSTRLLQCRAMAFGVLGDATNALHQWMRMLNGDGPVRFEGKHWFYLPRAVWNDEVFWRTLRCISPRIDRLGLLFGGLPEDAIGSASDPTISVRERKRTLRCFQSIIEYHLARVQRDLVALRRLGHAYPAWLEVADLERIIKDTRGAYVPPLSTRFKGVAALTIVEAN